MKKVILIIVVVLVALFLLTKTNQSVKHEQTGVYPWQIDIVENGSVRVFNITLEKTSLAEANVILNTEPKIALFESKTGLALEAFYKGVMKGGLGGDYILTMQADDKLLSEMKENIKKLNLKAKPMESGSIQYTLDQSSYQLALTLKVKSLNFIPYANLDEEIIVKRFGEPDSVITSKLDDDKEVLQKHYLYSAKGLDIILNTKGKEVLQYATPADFKRLVEPLSRITGQ